MNPALRFTLLSLAVVVVLFAVSWMTVPRSTSSDVPPPASLFILGLGEEGCPDGMELGVEGERCFASGRPSVEAISRTLVDEDLDALKTRIIVFYGSAAAVIVLVGLAFGAGRRSSQT